MQTILTFSEMALAPEKRKEKELQNWKLYDDLRFYVPFSSIPFTMGG